MIFLYFRNILNKKMKNLSFDIFNMATHSYIKEKTKKGIITRSK